MPVVIEDAVTKELKQLVLTLVDENYFATEKAAEKYVQEIYKFIRTIPNVTHRKIRKSAQNEFFVSYKANHRTTWYILFYTKNEDLFIYNLFNNHSPHYPAFIDSLR